MYNWDYLYYHVLMNPGDTFTMYGNYYNIYSYNLPSVAEQGYLNNDRDNSSSSLFRFRALPRLYDTVEEAQIFDHSLFNVRVENMALKDNDPNSNDQSASSRHMLGLSAFRTGECTFDLYNVNVEAFYMSITPENAHSTVNVVNSKLYNAWQCHLYIWNDNEVQINAEAMDYDPFANYKGIHVNISNSLVGKSGGPAILVQNANADRNCNKNAYTDIRVDSDSQVYSHVTGQEAWFVALGQTTLAGQIIAMNQLVAGTANAVSGGQVKASYTSQSFIQGVTTVNMMMVVMGTTLGAGDDYDATMVMNVTFEKDANGNLVYDESGRVKYESGTVGLNMTNNPAVDQFIAGTGGKAPVFQSSAASGTTYGTAYSDGATGLYVAPGAYAMPDTGCYEGDYISLYYMGLGIMLEYYH